MEKKRQAGYEKRKKGQAAGSERGRRRRGSTAVNSRHRKMIRDFIYSKNYQPMRAKDIAMLLDLTGKGRARLQDILNSLVEDRTIRVNEKGCYRKASPSPAAAGKKAEGEAGDKTVSSLGNVSEKRGRIRSGQVLEKRSQLGAALTEEISKVLAAYGIEETFPDRVMQTAEKCPEEIREADLEGRRDLRSLTMVTIDGEDARDLDDAVSLTKEGRGWELGVHIADVSHYVQGNSTLDLEALKRGTSVYLADRVIPMLPPRLSNGICSLNAGEDRLALSVRMKIRPDGEITDWMIEESVICVDRRMSYSEVARLFEEEEAEDLSDLKRDFPEIVKMLGQMRRLSGILRKRRRDRGGIDFEFPETEIGLDEDGLPVDVYPHASNEATRMIEDFMLAANETVAGAFREKKIPFIYRTHENPDEEKIEAALTRIHAMGIPAEKKGREISPKEVQSIMESIEGRPEEAMVSRMLLRSMKPARYTTEPLGHFGLAARNYCHFTSPIRRYPDLMIHRIIKEELRGRLTAKKRRDYGDRLEDIAWKSSALEKRAVEVERETNKLELAAYMQAHIGEEFEGVISGVTDWGFYVELPNTVEGLVPVSSLSGDYYELKEDLMLIEGRRHGRQFRMGQRVRVRATAADTVRKIIDFAWIED